MISPFAIDPYLSSHFPSPEQLQAALTKAPRLASQIVARLWLTEGIPAAFLSSPYVYEDLRGWLSSRLNVHPKEVTLIGSARIGYSLAPPPAFGRQFRASSDLDLSIVSDDLFQRVAAASTQFSVDFRAGSVAANRQDERDRWESNIAFIERNLSRGFVDPNKLPNLDRYPVIQQVGQAMWLLKKKLEVTPGAPRVRRASTRVYRDWRSFIERVSFNLRSAMRML
jgi:hypothetical protein